MLNKLFLVLFAIAIAICALITFMASSQLLSRGFPPLEIMTKFDYLVNVHWYDVWISTIVLLILANILLWINRSAWSLWLVFLFFAVGIMLNTWWLTSALVTYSQQNGLPTPRSSLINGFFAVVLVIVGGIFVYFEQFIVFRLRDKIYGEKNKVIEEIVSAKNESA